MLISIERARPVKRLLMFSMLSVLGLAFTLTARPVDALTVTAIDSGFVTEAGGSAKGDGTISSPTYNYSVGREVHYIDGFFSATTVAMDRNNYFVFDFVGVTTPIASASIDIYAGTFESVDASETFDLVAPMDPGAALGDAAFLLFENGVGPSSFDDAGDPAIGVATAFYGNIVGGVGSPLGSTSISSIDDETILTIAFGPAGLAYLNSFLGGVVVIGGSISTVVPPGTPQEAFGFTGPDIAGGDPLTPSLELSLVLEPGTATLLALGLLGLSVTARRDD